MPLGQATTKCSKKSGHRSSSNDTFMSEQQPDFIYPLGTLSQDFEETAALQDSGDPKTVVVLSIVGVILIACMLASVIRFTRRAQEQQQANNAHVSDNHTSEIGSPPTETNDQPKMIDPHVLDSFRVTLKASHFQTSKKPICSPQGRRASSISFTIDQRSGMDDAEPRSRSKSMVLARDTASESTRETYDDDSDDDSILFDLEEGSKYLTVTTGCDETREVPHLCAICLASYKVGETIVCLPLCRHAYHYSCIQQVLPRDSKCPLCRLDLAPTADSFTIEGSQGVDSVSTEASDQEETSDHSTTSSFEV